MRSRTGLVSTGLFYFKFDSESNSTAIADSRQLTANSSFGARHSARVYC